MNSAEINATEFTIIRSQTLVLFLKFITEWNKSHNKSVSGFTMCVFIGHSHHKILCVYMLVYGNSSSIPKK